MEPVISSDATTAMAGAGSGLGGSARSTRVDWVAASWKLGSAGFAATTVVAKALACAKRTGSIGAPTSPVRIKNQTQTIGTLMSATPEPTAVRPSPA